MFILGDESKSNGKVPWVTFSLIAINILAFCAQKLIGDELTLGFSLIPKEISTLTDLTKPEHVHAKVPGYIRLANGHRERYFRDVWVTVPQAPGPFPIFLTLFTSMFLHGGWMHLAGNMWFLAVFGRNVECALNHGRFLAFYVLCGVVGGLVYTMTDAASVIPCLGASGAISGVMGAYVAINPLNLVSVWVWFFYGLGFYSGVIRVPAFVVVGFWFVFQYIAAFYSLEYAGTKLGGTAYWDHLGGFFTGIAFIWGTVRYLRVKKVQEALAAEETPVVAQPEEESDDPFAACLPVGGGSGLSPGSHGLPSNVMKNEERRIENEE